MTHTPRPWKVTRWSDKRLSVDRGTHSIATLNDSGDETEANARLITAAPDLLAALDAVLPDLEHYVATHGPGPDRRLAQARAAIAAAKENTDG